MVIHQNVLFLTLEPEERSHFPTLMSGQHRWKSLFQIIYLKKYCNIGAINYGVLNIEAPHSKLRESSTVGKCPFLIRSLTPLQAARNALAVSVQ